MTIDEWWPDWSGQDIAIIASGPSALHTDLSLLEHTRTVVVNTTVTLYPEADMLYACDWRWWDCHDGCPDFEGIKVTAARRAAEKFNIGFVECDRRVHTALMGEPGVIGYGDSSGFQALNLAMQMRPSRIILIGYDMHLKKGTHWHGAHPEPLTNPSADTMQKTARYIDAVEDVACLHGIEILNATPGSSLVRYPHIKLESLFC